MGTRSKIPNAIDVEVGRRIRMRRALRGLSQGGLASRLGISFQQVQKYEKGTNRVGASRLQAIAEILDAPVAFFFDGQELTQSDAEFVHGDEIMSFLSTAEGLALNKSFAQIQDADIRRKVVGLVRSLANSERAQES